MPNTDCPPTFAKQPIWGLTHSSPSWPSPSSRRRCADHYNQLEIKANAVDHAVTGKATLEATMHSIDLTYASWLIRPDAKLPVGKLESRIIIDSTHLGRYMGITDLMVEAPPRKPTTPPAAPPNPEFPAATGWCSAARRSRRTSTTGSASRWIFRSPPTTRRRWCSPRPASSPDPTPPIKPFPTTSGTRCCMRSAPGCPIRRLPFGVAPTTVGARGSDVIIEGITQGVTMTLDGFKQ